MAEMTLLAPDEAPDAGQSRRPMDAELLAIGRILRILEDLELGAEKRVMVYLSDRFKAGA